MGEIAGVLNASCVKYRDAITLGGDKERELSASLDGLTDKMKSFTEVSEALGRSLSTHEVLTTALSQSMRALGAFGGAIYMKDGDSLRLEISKGFSGTFFYRGEEAQLSGRPEELFENGRPHLFASMEEYQDGAFRELLAGEGAASMVSTPVIIDEAVVGYMDLVFNEPPGLIEWDMIFLTAIAANISVSLSYSKFFCDEYEKRAVLYRTVRQMPLALAVFGTDGVCVQANELFVRYMRWEAGADFIGGYNVLADDGFFSADGMEQIKKSFTSGIPADFTVRSKRVLAIGPIRVFKVKSYPVYDDGGNIATVGVILEEIPEGGQGSPAAKGQA